MSFNLNVFLRKVPIPLIYGVSGWIIGEVPVILGALPASIDGYSTASVTAGGLFMIGAANWIHQELAPYVNIPSSTSILGIPAAAAAGSQPKPAPQQAQPFTLSASIMKGSVGQKNTLSVVGNSGSWQLFQNGVPGPISGKQEGSSMEYNETPTSPIGAIISAEGSVQIYAVDESGEESNVVTLS
jgi:hypothetical protein